MDCIRSIGAATYAMGGGRTVFSAAHTNGGWPINGLRGRYHHEPHYTLLYLSSSAMDGNLIRRDSFKSHLALNLKHYIPGC